MSLNARPFFKTGSRDTQSLNVSPVITEEVFKVDSLGTVILHRMFRSISGFERNDL